MSTCRFCKNWKGEMVKYEVRHYAHFECYLDAGKKLEDLHDWQIGKFPYRLIKARGLEAIALAAHERVAASNA